MAEGAIANDEVAAWDGGVGCEGPVGQPRPVGLGQADSRQSIISGVAEEAERSLALMPHDPFEPEVFSRRPDTAVTGRWRCVGWRMAEMGTWVMEFEEEGAKIELDDEGGRPFIILDKEKSRVYGLVGGKVIRENRGFQARAREDPHPA